MTHVLAAARQARTSLRTYWPPAAIGVGLAASLVWSAFLGYVAIRVVGGLTGRLVEYLSQ
jgi:hypothetical protein